jgi:hypothetical protein
VLELVTNNCSQLKYRGLSLSNNRKALSNPLESSLITKHCQG